MLVIIVGPWTVSLHWVAIWYGQKGFPLLHEIEKGSVELLEEFPYNLTTEIGFCVLFFPENI